MKLGAFSTSLSVKDIRASKQFYENLGFSVFAGDIEQNWLIMKNGNALIGLFQGMFENNILTFNPGWDENAQLLEEYDDVRAIQKELKNKGVKFEREADETTSGPCKPGFFRPGWKYNPNRPARIAKSLILGELKKYFVKIFPVAKLCISCTFYLTCMENYRHEPRIDLEKGI